VDALDGRRIGDGHDRSNDAGYVPAVMRGLPRSFAPCRLLGGVVCEMLDPTARERALVDLGESLKKWAVCCGSVTAGEGTVVDYLTLLPQAGRPTSAAMVTSRSAIASPTRWSASRCEAPRNRL